MLHAPVALASAAWLAGGAALDNDIDCQGWGPVEDDTASRRWVAPPDELQVQQPEARLADLGFNSFVYGSPLCTLQGQFTSGCGVQACTVAPPIPEPATWALASRDLLELDAGAGAYACLRRAAPPPDVQGLRELP